jgi:beta-lactamase regulating signal transducer with metallopeptidase domain
MDYQLFFNSISLQLLIFTICSGAIVLLSWITIRLNPLLAGWSRFWLFTYLLTFLSFFPIAFIPFDNSSFYALKDLFTLNQKHLVIHATTNNYIPNDAFDVSVFIKLILVLVLSCTLIALTIFTLRTRKVLKLIKKAKHISFIEGISEEQQKEIERRQIKLLISPDVPPLAYGFFSKYILLPESIEIMKLEHKKMLIEHEIQHHRKNDTKKVILMRFLTGLFWFNPFLHYIEKRFLLSMEINCDEEVVNLLKIEPRDYAQSQINCLEVCKNSNFSKLTAYFSSPNSLKEELEIRIKKIMNKSQEIDVFNRAQLFTFCLVSTLIVVFIKSGFIVVNFSSADEGQMPISNGYISFDYSESKTKPHSGIDIQAAPGSIIKASFTGRVIVSDDSSLDKGFGVTVLVEHKDNATSLYANLNQVFVEVGQIIKAGEAIGTLGNTLGQGNDKKPHLHFEISKSGLHLNPNLFLNGYDN